MWVILTLTIMAAVELIVAATESLLKGSITPDYMLTGLIASGIVVPSSLALVNYLLDELALQTRLVLQHNLGRIEDRLKVALESTEEGVLMVDRSGNVLAFNTRFIQLWNIPPAIVEIGHDDQLLAHVLDQLSDPKQFMAQVRRLYQTDDEANDTLHFKDGRVFTRYTRALSLGVEPGRIWCFRDVTEQARVQQALSEREELYRTIVTQANDAIALIDAQTLAFIEFNDAVCNGLGYTRAEFQQLSLPDILSPPDQVHMPGGMRNAAALHRHKDGSLRHVLVSTRSIELHDRQLLVATWSDVTVLKHVEEELRRSEQELVAIVDNLDACIYLKDSDGRYLFANRAVRELWQVEQTDIVGHGDDIFFDEATVERIRQNNQRILDAGEAICEDIAYTTTSGRTVICQTTKVPLRREDGSIYGLCGISIDITARKQAELNLTEREAQLRTLIEAIPDSIQFKDGAGRWQVANSVCLRLFGLEGKNWKGLTDLEIGQRYPQLADALSDCTVSDEKAWDAATTYRTQEKIADATGNTFDFDVIKVPLYDEQHAREALVIVGRDITERNQAQAALAESRNLLQTIIDTAPIRVFWKDLKLRYMGCNPAFSKDAGIADPADLIGLNDYQMPWFDHAAEYQKDDRRVLETGIVKLAYEEPQTTPDGKRIYLRTSKVPLRDSNSRIIGVLGIYEDITEQKRIEQRLTMAIEVTQVVLWEFDVPNNRLEFNQNALPILGLAKTDSITTIDELIGRVHPDDRQSVKEQLAQTLQVRDGLFELEYRLLTPSGQTHWIHSRGGVTQRAADGQPILAVGTSMNITVRKQAEAELFASETRLRMIIANEPECIKLVDEDGRLLQMNPAGLRMIGADTEEQVIGHCVFDLVTSEYRAAFIEMNRRVIAGEPMKLAFEIVGLKGEHRWLETHAVPIIDKGRTVALGVTQDITERKLAEEKLHLAASVFTHAREGILITAANGTIIDVNEAFTRITGYERHELLGRQPSLLKSGLQDDAFYTVLWRELLDNKRWQGEMWNRHKNGTLYAVMETISAVPDSQGRTLHYVALLSDITPIKEHEKQLEHIAHYDPLTTLPNRLLLADRLHQAMAQGQRREQRFAVAYLDLDGFKAVNDRHGHDIGDQLLVTVARRMKQTLRDGDTLARLGGDEFVAVLLDLPDTVASAPMLERMLQAVAQPVAIGELLLQVSASIGVTFYPQTDDIDADHLLRQADQAMYQAKLGGKNRYHVFDADKDRSIRGHNESLKRIEHAIAENEFVLHYQPKVNMRSGSIIGAEALIRWQHPQQGLLPPSAFLPAIEGHPLALRLGEWVIDHALAQIQHWHRQGLDIQVSVNVSAYHLQQPSFVARLQKILAGYPDIAASSLMLEVLETSALEDVIQASQVIAACRSMGVMFSLDDFGTGYSSLTYLKRLPVAEIKVDQSFVRDMLDDPDDLAIVEGVIGFATAFRRRVVAEGVETTEHGRLLLQLGCERAQGFGIARPMPAEQIAAWAAAWTTHPSWNNQRSVSRDNIPVLFAGVEHRAWAILLAGYIKGELSTSPQLDFGQCRLGMWLENEGRSRYDGNAAVLRIDSLHRQLHELAIELVALRDADRTKDALALLNEFLELQDHLLELMQQLLA